jgi:anhydro-N-acetylmuramic acid kinase
MPNRPLFIGLISGTSLDGIDAVLVEAGEGVPKLLKASHSPYEESLQKGLRRLCQPGDNEIDLLGVLDRKVAIAFAESVQDLLADSGLEASEISAIGSHGQTIRHRPMAEHPFTLQIGDPNTLAELTGITTVSDFRRRDMAAGGEGAPLVPAFHQAALQISARDRIALNLGGIANITCLPKTGSGTVIGFDTGPANTLMDGWISKHLGNPYDSNGDWAREGQLIQPLLDECLRDSYFSQPHPKSTGTEYFNLPWLETRLDDSQYVPVDVQHTLAELTAVSVTQAIEETGYAAAEVLVCGGGVHNNHLMQRLQQLLPKAKVHSSAEAGLDPDWVEATAFAWLAQRSLSGLAGNLPSVTGARGEVILGGIYPAG